jgi:hypothetical protein
MFDGAGENEGLARIGTGGGRRARGGRGGAANDDGTFYIGGAEAPLPFWAAGARDAAEAAGVGTSRTGLGNFASRVGGAAAGIFPGIADSMERADAAAAEAFDAERVQQFADVAGGAADQLAKGFAASAASAILFGESFEKGVNQALRALALQAASESLYQGAKALAFLAMGNPAAATLAGEAAAAFGLVATLAGAGAAATGGLRGGGGGRGRGAAGGGEVGPDRSQPTTFSPTIIVGLDGDVVYDRMTRITDDREGSRSRRRFAMAA